eukprot:c22640_g2_i1 orf=2-853(-)
MEEKGISDTWDWEDQGFRLDVESPLAISQSLWEGFTQSEEDVATLFASTPASQMRDSESSCFIFATQDRVEPISSDQNVPDYSPHFKRRRMLHFQGEENAINASNSPLEMVPETLESYSDSFIGGCEDFQMHESTSDGTIWYIGNDESLSSVDDAAEQSAESWMSRCFNDRESQTAQYQMNFAVPMIASEAERQANANEVLHGHHPATSFSCRSAISGRTLAAAAAVHSNTSCSRPKLATPVAYPFAVVKPSGMQGDVTLNDINQRIMMPPNRPLPHVAAAAAA